MVEIINIGIAREGSINDVDNAIDDVSRLLKCDWFGDKNMTDRLIIQLDFISHEIMSIFGNVKSSNAVGYIREKVEMATFSDVDIINIDWTDMYPYNNHR